MLEILNYTYEGRVFLTQKEDVDAFAEDIMARKRKYGNGYSRNSVQINADLGPMPKDLPAYINEALFKRFENMDFRSYAYYEDKDCNFDYLAEFPDLAELCIETGSSQYPQNLDKITNIKKLKKLTLQCANIGNFDFLSELPHLEELKLTRLESYWSIKPNFESIASLKKLRKLTINGYKNGMEAISELPNLEELTCVDTTVKDWSFVPDYTLKRIFFNNVKCKIPLDSSILNADEIQLARMSKLKLKNISELFSEIQEYNPGQYSVFPHWHILEQFPGHSSANGYDWRDEFKTLLPDELKSRVKFDPEAGFIYMYSDDKSSLESTLEHLYTALKKKYNL